jgi:4-hydroxy-4-methyl-2-oxoglutarate aldolase
MTTNRLTSSQLDQLRKLSTCVVASTIETFGVHLRNTGFANSSIRCIFPELPSVAGYAATARIRSSEPPMEGGTYHDHGRAYYDHRDWWNHILTIPEPRVVVIEDLDKPSGLGAFLGEVHTNILFALGCIGALTNGTVRDLPEVRPAGFQMFAGGLAVSHAYAHIFDFGGTVEVGGLKVTPGDLIHGDIHGVQTIPMEIAGKIPAVASKLLKRRHHLVELCRSADFSLEKLQSALKEAED